VIETPGFALFHTAIGTCGIAWATQGVVGLQLAESTEARMRALLRRRFPDAAEVPPPLPTAVQSAIDGIVALLNGGSSDLSFVALDMHGVPEFDQRVYGVARTIPPGSTLTYGDIAARLGEPAWPAARDVGQALAHNPFPIVVPCHRVLAAGGKLGGFSARGGLVTKRRLLAIETAAAAAFNIPLFAELQ
jgi:methylated-DNA-[protein]-cysteine S-methyltransferase